MGHVRERLGRLEETGAVDEQEFAAQKRLIIEYSSDSREPENRASLVLAPG